MKFNILLVFVFTFCCVYGLKFDFEHAEVRHKDCLGRAHSRPFSQRKLDQLNHGQPVEIDDYESILHLMCVFKERRIMSEDGAINKEVAKKIAKRVIGDGESAAKDVKEVEDCAVQKETQEDTARFFYNCVAPIVKKLNSE